jgi:hypothetical protein
MGCFFTLPFLVRSQFILMLIGWVMWRIGDLRGAMLSSMEEI